MHASNFGLHMPVKSILVATDLSILEHHALERAKRLATMHGAALKLMYVPPFGESPAPNAARRLAREAWQVENELQRPVGTVPVKARSVEDVATEARGMDLVVVPHRHERSTAAFFRGQPVMRLIRECSAAVLEARTNTSMPYRRILVAVDFSSNSAALARLAANLEPEAELQVLHVIDTRNEARLRAAEATEQAVSAYRDRCLEYAHHRIRELTRPLEALGRRVVPIISHGDPGQQAVRQREQSGADLVIVGWNKTSAWQNFFCGSVAHRVLSWGGGDALVAPDAYLRADTRAAAWPAFGLEAQGRSAS